MSKESIKYEMADKRNWREIDILREENKELKSKFDILEEKYQWLVNSINQDGATIDRLSKKHYHIAKDNSRQLNRIIEEIDSINIFIKDRMKND